MVECSDAYWPHALTYADGQIQPEDADAWARFDDACARRAVAEDRIFVSLTSTGSHVEVDAGTRKRLSRYLNGRSKESADCRKVHMVMSNPVIRGVVKALSWLSTNRSVDRIQPHASLGAAIEAARRELGQTEVDWAAVERWFAQRGRT